MPSRTSDSLISTGFSARCRLDIIIRTLMILECTRSSSAAKVKIANSDVYSQGYAEFVETFERVVGLRPLEHYLFIEGGALAVENCLKAAMDWKVRKNMAAGRGERGTQILHFRHAFHGRSGYTMSLTNTDPRKTDLFAKFDWPRVSCPHIDFALPESKREADVIEREQRAEREILDFIQQRNVDICAIIIEPIQGEGGDNHFRGEWLIMAETDPEKLQWDFDLRWRRYFGSVKALKSVKSSPCKRYSSNYPKSGDVSTN